ncbi:hypothetical protein PsorP6_015429 [Peronosclerospora sorghi]|uniref:Uncharacterized protein n=1 Tax=Peronosclerospora sorghi TaxID=230839 RepID=A0ACC0WPA5_9STRA|nr:hypothetical protein PsorP6_015429 [Peronosclerospora sorghi]
MYRLLSEVQAHDNGVLHRDFKYGKLVLNKEWEHLKIFKSSYLHQIVFVVVKLSIFHRSAFSSFILHQSINDSEFITSVQILKLHLHPRFCNGVDVLSFGRHEFARSREILKTSAALFPGEEDRP